MRYEPFDWYQTPLYYDIVFDADTETEADFLQAVHQRHGRSRGRRVLEPACGSGRLVGAMVRRGYQVSGFDRSPQMLQFARRRLADQRLRARLSQGSLDRFRYRDRFDLIHCLVSTVKYLPAEETARSHLRSVADSLKPGGVYVLGLHLSDYDSASCTRERWVARRGGVEVTCNIQIWPPDRRRRAERLRSRLIVRERGVERRYETHWVFRTYSAIQLSRLIRSVPVLEHVATYDFCHDISRPIPFDGEHLDVVLVLRRGSDSPPPKQGRA